MPGLVPGIHALHLVSKKDVDGREKSSAMTRHDYDHTSPKPRSPPPSAPATWKDINGLRIHVLEAGFEASGRPCVLLLHGFPELAFSWRKVMPVLADAGYHVIAPDQRGYGRTTGWDPNYEGGLGTFRLPNLVRDALGLVSAFGYRNVDAVFGHDSGSPLPPGVR